MGFMNASTFNPSLIAATLFSFNSEFSGTRTAR
jgi:hypothetical protein